MNSWASYIIISIDLINLSLTKSTPLRESEAQNIVHL